MALRKTFTWLTRLVTFWVFSVNAGYAEEVLPSHVYQASKTVVSLLVEMNEVNNSLPDEYETTVTNRQPRHVIQKARELYLRVLNLREELGLPRKMLAPLPTQEVRPADVKHLVDLITTDLRELSKKYDPNIDARKFAYQAGKTPTDVYRLLHSAVYLMDALSIDPTTPSNVYRIAIVALQDMKLIHEKLGIAARIERKPVADKVPADVFEKTRSTIATIKDLCATSRRYCIPGGVTVPDDRSWWREYFDPTQPKHVLDLVNSMVAEVSALKKQLGITEQKILPHLAVGKTPSDVYALVEMVNAHLKALTAGPSKH